MPPKRDARLVARKSAPSSFSALTSPPPPISPRSPRSASPSSLGERLAYIDRKGLPQRDACVECQHRGLASRCVVAPRVSSRCGNCLRAGKTCTFPLVLNSDSDSDSESQEDMIVGGEGNGIASTEGLLHRLVNYDPDDSDSHSPQRLRLNSQTPSTLHLPTIPSPKSPKSAIKKPAAARKMATRNPPPPPPVAPSTSLATPVNATLPPFSHPPPRPVTPSLALGSFDSAGLVTSPGPSPVPIRASPAIDLSPADRRAVILALQEQADWGLIAETCGLSVDKVMHWWMKASAEIVRRP